MGDEKRIDRLIAAMENLATLLTKIYQAEYAKHEQAHERVRGVVRARARAAKKLPAAEPSNDVKLRVESALRRMGR